MPDVRHEIDGAGRIDRPAKTKRKNAIAPDQTVSHREKVYGRNFGRRAKEGGKSGADGKKRFVGESEAKGDDGERVGGMRGAYTCPRWRFRDKVDS